MPFGSIKCRKVQINLINDSLAGLTSKLTYQMINRTESEYECTMGCNLKPKVWPEMMRLSLRTCCY